MKYNEAKDEPTYTLFGPPGEGDTPIAIMAGWDDHDFAGNEPTTDPETLKMIITDADKDYPCKYESQARLPIDNKAQNLDSQNFYLIQEEWSHFVNMPESEPQHPNSPNYRQGIYHSRMFIKPGTNESGIHSIILDNRSERDNVYTSRVVRGDVRKKQII